MHTRRPAGPQPLYDQSQSYGAVLAISGKPSTYLRCMLPVPFFPSSDLAEVIEFLATLYPSCLYRLSIRSSRATCTVTPRPVDCWPDWVSQRRKRKDKETTPERERGRFKIICETIPLVPRCFGVAGKATATACAYSYSTREPYYTR